MQIEISEDTYKAIAERHGDVAAYLERLARRAIAAPDARSDKPNGTPKSLADALAGNGLLGKYDDLPAALSSNPEHLSGFGEE